MTRFAIYSAKNLNHNSNQSKPMHQSRPLRDFVVAHHPLAEVVEDHALAGAAFVGLGIAAVEEVGVPDEYIALGRVKIGAGQA